MLRLILGLAMLASSILAMPAALAATGTCAPATSRGPNGPTDYPGYCWIDFSGYVDATARSAGGQPFTITLAGGGTMTFTLKVTGNSPAVTAATMPSWSGAPMGQSAFVGVPGSPVLYQATNGATNTITLSSIVVTVGAGQVPYAFVAADAESTNDGESLNFVTNGNAWTLLSTMQNGSSTLYPTLSGVGTTTVSEAGVAGTVGAYAFASEGSPTTISSTMVGSGLQGIAFAVKYRAADIEITSTANGSFPAGGSGSYTLKVKSNGPDDYLAAATFTVTDTLPTGLGFVSASGTGWSCSYSAPTVTCTRSGAPLSGASFPDITVNVGVNTAAPASVTNNASVAVATGYYDYNAANNTTSTAKAIAHPNFSTSTKDVEDVNGGLALPGDTVRYTINLAETAGIAAVNAQVTDVLDANLGSLSVVSLPPGATNASSGSTLNITGISLPANGTATIIFTAVISGTATDGTVINNTATVKTSGGVTVGSAVADPLTVTLVQPSAPGNKYLYLNTNLSLTRARPGAGTVTVSGNAPGGAGACFTQASLPGALTLVNGTATVTLRVQRSSTATGNRRLRLRLFQNGTATSLTSTNPADINVNTAAYNSFADATWNVTLNDTSFTAGQYIVVCVQNRDAGAGRGVTLSQNDGGSYSFLKFNASTVIQVDSVKTYAAAYGLTTTKTRYIQGDTAYIRAVVSDPFGSADITGANVKITDAGGTAVVTAGAMTSVDTPTSTTRVYEYAYLVPANPRIGGWDAEVSAREGDEIAPDQVVRTGLGGFPVEGKVTLGKAWTDGVAGNTVSLVISGATSATGGTSTPASTTAATATSVASATLTLTEAFSVGVATDYTSSLACVRDKDAVSLSLGGSGLSRTISMPDDSAVTCTFTNRWNKPLTVVKLSTVVSDPVNGTTNPKAIPGAIVEYQLIFTNPESNQIDNNTIIATDVIPARMDLRVVDIAGPGSGPVQFVNGSPSSGLTYTYTSPSSATDDVAFSSNNGATWTHAPAADANGTDPAVTTIRINPKGAFNGSNAQFTLKLRMRVE